MFKMKKGFFLAAILGLILLLPQLSEAWRPARVAAPLDNWTSINLFSTTVALNATADNGVGTMYVAVGNLGTILSSQDGMNWANRTSTGFTKNLYGVAFGAGRFVAVGDTKSILLSTDGKYWTTPSGSTAPVAGNLKAITYGNGKFVVVGESGRIYTSVDGNTWIQPQAKFITTATLVSVTYGDGQFVAVGTGGTILISKDSNLWVKNTLTLGGSLQGIAYGIPLGESKGIWVAVNTSGTVFVSYNGLVSWTSYKSSVTGFTAALYDVTYANGIFTAAGANGTIINSTDGMVWRLAELPLKPTTGTAITTAIRAIGTNGSVYYAVGDTGIILASSNPYEWPYRSETLGILQSVAFGNNLFVATGQYGNLFTYDGTSLTESRFTGSYFNQPYMEGVAYGAGLFVAVGDQDEDSTVPAVFTSVDGFSWAQRSPDYPDNSLFPATTTGQNLYGVTYGNGLFVAVGTDGVIIYSDDGVTWLAGNSPTANDLTGVVFGNGTYVAVGYKTIITSTDGVNWNTVTVTTPPSFEGVTYGNGTFVAVANSGAVYTSTAPSATWVKQATLSALYGVTYGESPNFVGFVAVGAAGGIYSSPNGITWTKLKSNTASALMGVAFGNNLFVAAGYSSTIAIKSGE